MKMYLKFLIKTILIFLICGSMYYGIKLLCYGEAHIVMFLLAGVCGMVFVDPMYSFFYPEFSLLTQIIGSTILCIISEGCCGIMINVVHQYNIWDYSDLQGTFLLGQCNIYFTWIWLIVVITGIIFCDTLNYYWIKYNPRTCYKIKNHIIFQFKNRRK